MPSAVPSPDASEEVYLGIFAETVRAVTGRAVTERAAPGRAGPGWAGPGRAEQSWPRPYPHPYPDEVVIPPPRPASEPPAPPPAPQERTVDLRRPRPTRIGRVRPRVDDPTEPALAMLSRGRHGM